MTTIMTIVVTKVTKATKVTISDRNDNIITEMIIATTVKKVTISNNDNDINDNKSDNK